MTSHELTSLTISSQASTETYFAKITDMAQSGLTNEFSICLLLNTKTTRTVQAIRQTLAASPYRDDTPHVTLLRTIKSPTHMGDRDLLEDMERLLQLSARLPLSATVLQPANRFSPLFRVSSLVLLKASPEVKMYRKNIIRVLKANNYSISLFERLIYLPHISIRLGVPYSKQARATTEQSFRPGTQVIFNKWILLRDIKKDGKYLVKEIALDV